MICGRAPSHHRGGTGPRRRWRGNFGKLRGGWQTAGVVFVADALGGWLVGQLADAGRKKLTELVLGSEQERALRRAADAAVWATAEEMSSSDGEQAGQVAMVISEVFRDPRPGAPLAGPVMLLEGLQAGIAGQLAVLDDAGLTGTGQSSADVLGMPGTVLADRLTGHLVREIIVRGSGGGPLTPLADQFNHELTRLQIEGMFARLAGEVRDALARPGSGVMVAGRPLEEVTDPFVLEVHRPVQPEDAPAGLPVLPPYVLREHDQVLGQVVRAAADGRSGIAVLVGGSSVGKTRACWEALALLRDRDPPWRLWHPIDPSRPDAALAELRGIGPRTVVWLNEAQFYLDPAEAGLGEKVAAGLRELLRDPGRAPVLVLATMWPRFWDTLTARPADGEDQHAQARELLAGHDITVPAAFTPAQLDQLARAADVRMALAATSARDGEAIQFLAGAPELLARYRNAPPAAAALIDAAMDARRLGMEAGLPQAFLEAAVPGYLTGAQWDALGEDWLEQALAYTAVPCQGARGPLTRIGRPASRAVLDRGDQSGALVAPAGPLYRLADYLDQHGRAHRASQIPPVEFWSAAAAHAAPGDQATLGGAAHARGLYRAAAQLHKNAAAAGNPRAVSYLSDPPACLRADPRPAHWAAAHTPLDDPRGVASLLFSLREAGADEQATALAGRAAAHMSLDDPRGVAYLLESLRQAGAGEQAAALLARDPAAHTPLDDPTAVAYLLGSLQRAGAGEQAAALAGRAAAHTPLDNQSGLSLLLGSLQRAGAGEQAAALAGRAAAGTPLDDPAGVASLLDSLRGAGAGEQAAALAGRAAADTPLDDPAGVASLLDDLRRAGAGELAAALLARDPAAHTALDDPRGVASLLFSLREAGAGEQAAALARRAAAHTPLDHPQDVAYLLFSLREAGAGEQAAALAGRAAADTPLDDPAGVAYLLDSLQQAGAGEQAAVLAGRAAADTPLDDPAGVASLLGSLRLAGADEQAAALLARDPAARTALDDPRGVAYLLGSLRLAGADEQAAALLARDPAARTALDDPRGVAYLLESLEQAGAGEQAAALAGRAAAHTSLDNPHDVAYLLGSLREAGADEQAAALLARDPAARTAVDDPRGVAYLLESLEQAGADEQAATLTGRLPAVGMFWLFLKEQKGLADQFHFGREADGSPAAPWGWEDLDLWFSEEAIPAQHGAAHPGRKTADYRHAASRTGAGGDTDATC